MDETMPPIPPRGEQTHKGEMGRAVLVAGCKGMPGAAILAARAALRGGVGYAVVIAPAALSADLAAAVPEAIFTLQGEANRTHLQVSDLDEILSATENAQAIGIGPGLGPDAQALTLALLLRLPTHLPRILDADALNHLAAADVDLRELMTPQTILTPHPGEAARLLQWPGGAEEIQAKRSEAHSALIERTGATVVLKGAGSLVGSPDSKTWKNLTGNSGMATAGSGDVLTGLLAALLARGMTPSTASRLGVHLHVLAGDLAAKDLGTESLIASDLVDYLPVAFQSLAQS